MRKKKQPKKIKVKIKETGKIGFIFSYALNYFNFPVYFNDNKKIMCNFADIEILK